MPHFASGTIFLLFTALGCSSGVISSPEGSSGATGSAGSGTTIDAAGSGLPCDVTALLQHYCVGCHSSPPTGGAPQPLMTYANLTAAGTTDPSKTVGALSVTYLHSGLMPPKPAAAPTATELATFESWVGAGMPKTTCSVEIDAGVATSPYDTPLKCTSGSTWLNGDSGSASMHPGVACIACHTARNDGPKYAIAGTVFPSAHEPDDCNGAATSSSGALSVLITEANGNTHTLPVNGAGNFFLRGTITTPYTAQVNAGTAVRVMTHTQTSGDCNGCHTVNGSSNTPGATSAPGRIMAP